jgi:hypothetical protein
MRFDLKPLSFGEVLDGSFKIFRGNLGLFLTVALVFNGPTVLVSAWLRIAQQGVPAGKLPSGYGMAMLVILAASLLLWGTMTAAAVQVVTNEPTSLGKSFSRFARILGPAVVGAFLLFIFTGLFALLLLIPGIIYFLGRGLFLPVLLVEGGKGGASLKRSKQLVGKIRKGRMDRMFGASLVFGVLSWALIWGIGLLIPAGLKTTFAGAVLGLLPQIVLAPLLPIAYVLIYFDARIRDEGYDLELRAKEAGAGAAPAATAGGGGAVAGPA